MKFNEGEEVHQTFFFQNLLFVEGSFYKLCRHTTGNISLPINSNLLLPLLLGILELIQTADPIFLLRPGGQGFFGNPAHRGGDGTTSPNKALASSTLFELEASEQHIVAMPADMQHG